MAQLHRSVELYEATWDRATGFEGVEGKEKITAVVFGLDTTGMKDR